MQIQIEVTVMTKNDEYSILLPQAPDDFLNTLKKMNLSANSHNAYKIRYANSSYKAINHCIASAKKIEELNCLAQLLNGCNDMAIKTLSRCFNPQKSPPNIHHLLDVVHHFAAASKSVL